MDGDVSRTPVSTEPASTRGEIPGTDREPGAGDPVASETTASFTASTQPADIDADRATAPDADPAPSSVRRIGRYAVIRPLGEGGFGRVYLARDEELGRLVAIKVPKPEAFAGATDVESFVREARMAASLKHPAIVVVHDVGREPDGLVFVVLEYIEGTTLAHVIRSARVEVGRAAEWAARVAEALHVAHTHGLVHRDLKPSNVLIDRAGRPHVADFGMALHEDGLRLRSGEVAGTPPYMAPEQVRGETHRFDGRTDIWGLGVVFYQLLTGRLPFVGSRPELFEEIQDGEPKPPRQVDDAIPRELERICLKCLSKRMSDRYMTAADLALDLNSWREAGSDRHAGPAREAGAATAATPPDHAAPPRVVPKGLRSFDAGDADFFLSLLPGPRGRDGLPESLRFWKAKLEATDPEETFPVGLLYGPSGCGKSSLVKAGLIPRLPGRVRVVYVESSPEETESRLARGARRLAPGLPATASLPELVLALREGTGRAEGEKVVFVLDQFEQWLHARGTGPGSELAAALRQCDGRSTQCLLMVRDDFGLAAMRLMHDLEVSVVEGWNYGIVDRFDPLHAARVLGMFGRAFGRLPAEGPPTAAQERFLNQAVEGLKEGGKVAPIRLALFADMFQGRPWDAAALRQMGGAEGIGVAFLEESLGQDAVDPRARSNGRALQQILKALLPEHATNLRGRMRSRPELIAAAGLEGRPREFEELLRLLHAELRLIMPGDPEYGTHSTDSTRSSIQERPRERYYQLTHDYLVPVLRRWLTRKHRETARGRAGLLLEDRAAVWAARPERRSLPTALEWATIRLLTDRAAWTDSQSRMMRSADRLRSVQLAAAAGLLVLVALAGEAARRRVAREQRRVRSEVLASQLFAVEEAALPGLLDAMRPDRPFWRETLARVADDVGEPVARRTRAQLALVDEEPDRLPPLLERLMKAGPGEHRAILHSITPWVDRALPRLRAVAGDPAAPRDRRLRAACALAAVRPGDPALDLAEADVARALLGEEIFQLTGWAEALEPMRSRLVAPLAAMFRDPALAETDRNLAATLLARLGRDDPERLADLAADAGPRPFASLWPVLAGHRDRTAAVMKVALAAPTPPVSADGSGPAARRKAVAAVALLRLGEPGPAWGLLRAGPDPRVRSWLIELALRYGAGEAVLADRLASEADPSVRQALLLALGEGRGEAGLSRPPERMVDLVAALFANDPDPAVHAGAGWLLRAWGLGERADRAVAALRGKGRGGWSVIGAGLTMIVVPGPMEFRMGSPESEPRRDDVETPHRRRIGRTFAVSDREITLGQMRRLFPDFDCDAAVAPDPDCPAVYASWYDAVKFCRLLSEREGIDPGQMCYPPVDQIKPGLILPEDGLKRTGYRLPTEAEWEAVCRAGTETPFHFGDDEALLPAYAWSAVNSRARVWPAGRLKPNSWGFFDLHGNAFEHCNDEFVPYPIVAGFVDDVHWAIAPRKLHAIRSGGYRAFAKDARSAKRLGLDAVAHVSIVGFRVARTVAP